MTPMRPGLGGGSSEPGVGAGATGSGAGVGAGATGVGAGVGSGAGVRVVIRDREVSEIVLVPAARPFFNRVLARPARLELTTFRSAT